MAMELKIVVDDSGAVQVSGPIDNKVVAYGLLEVAKEAIATHHLQSQNKIQPAPAGLIIPRT